MPPSLSLAIDQPIRERTSVLSKLLEQLFPVVYSSDATSSVINAHLSLPLSGEVRFQLAKVDRMGALQMNWDGMGAIPPTYNTRRKAKSLIKDVSVEGFVPYHVGAGPSGEIFIEFITPVGRKAQVYVSAEDGHELLLIDGDEHLYDGVLIESRLLAHLHGG